MSLSALVWTIFRVWIQLQSLLLWMFKGHVGVSLKIGINHHHNSLALKSLHPSDRPASEVRFRAKHSRLIDGFTPAL